MTQAEKQALITEFQDSGKGIPQFCKLKGLKPSTFRGWLDKAGIKSEPKKPQAKQDEEPQDELVIPHGTRVKIKAADKKGDHQWPNPRNRMVRVSDHCYIRLTPVKKFLGHRGEWEWRGIYYLDYNEHVALAVKERKIIILKVYEKAES